MMFSRSLTIAACLMLPSAAMAQGIDAKKLAALIIMQAGANGMEVDISDAESVGNDVILRKVGLQDQDLDERIAEVRLENVRALPTGGYMIGRIAAPAMPKPADPKQADDDDDEGTWSLGAWSMTEILVPAQDDKKSVPFIPQGVEVQPSEFKTKAGKTVIEVGTISWTAAPYTNGEFKSSIAPVAVSIDTAYAFDDDDVPGQYETLRQLSGPKLNLQIGADSTWRESDGRLTLSTKLNWRDHGKLTSAFDIAGLTSDLFSGLKTASSQVLTSTPQDLLANGGITSLAALAQVKLNSLSLRFDDASVTNKIIDLEAKKNKTTRKYYLGQLKGSFPLGGLGDPKLAEQISAAIAAFLDNPKSIALNVAPSKPISPMELVMAGMLAQTSPQTLIQRLGISVTANK